MTTAYNTRQLLEQWPGLPDDIRQDLLSVISTRGKNKGYLLENAPSEREHPNRWAAWQSLVGFLAPVRVSTWGLILGGPAAKRYDEIETALKAADAQDHVLGGLFAFALNSAERPYRWNLWAHRYDHDKAQALVAERLYTTGV